MRGLATLIIAYSDQRPQRRETCANLEEIGSRLLLASLREMPERALRAGLPHLRPSKPAAGLKCSRHAFLWFCR